MLQHATKFELCLVVIVARTLRMTTNRSPYQFISQNWLKQWSWTDYHQSMFPVTTQFHDYHVTDISRWSYRHTWYAIAQLSVHAVAIRQVHIIIYYISHLTTVVVMPISGSVTHPTSQLILFYLFLLGTLFKEIWQDCSQGNTHCLVKSDFWLSRWLPWCHLTTRNTLE